MASLACRLALTAVLLSLPDLAAADRYGLYDPDTDSDRHYGAGTGVGLLGTVTFGAYVLGWWFGRSAREFIYIPGIVGMITLTILACVLRGEPPWALSTRRLMMIVEASWIAGVLIIAFAVYLIPYVVDRVRSAATRPAKPRSEVDDSCPRILADPPDDTDASKQSDHNSKQ